MINFSVGDKVRIISCFAREELTGVETVITQEASDEFTDLDYTDVYGVPAYRVEIDPDFRPTDSQLELID